MKKNDQECQSENNGSYVSVNLEERKIYIRGEINSHVANHFAIGFDKMRAQKKPVITDISSPGGDVINGLDVYNRMRNAVCPIITVTFGAVGSGALLVFLGGDERLISKNAMIRFHWPITIRDHEEINPDSTETDRDFFKKIFGHLGKIVADRTKLTLNEVKAYMRYSKAFNGEQAFEMGIATAIFEDEFPNKNKKGRK